MCVYTVNYNNIKCYSSLGLEKGECTDENLQKAKFMVPKSLEKYVERT